MRRDRRADDERIVKRDALKVGEPHHAGRTAARGEVVSASGRRDDERQGQREVAAGVVEVVFVVVVRDKGCIDAAQRAERYGGPGGLFEVVGSGP
jgi:hypothetical protein